MEIDLSQTNTREIVALVLSLWGAGLSTVLAVSNLRARARERWKLSVWVEASPANLKVEMVNVGLRPVTITGIELWYTDDLFHRQLVWSSQEESILYETARLVIAPSITMIRDSHIANEVKQASDCRLRVRVKTSSRSDIVAGVILSDELVPDGCFGRPRSFVGADVFLGFRPMPPEFGSGGGIRTT